MVTKKAKGNNNRISSNCSSSKGTLLPPAGWPSDVQYIPHIICDKSVTPEFAKRVEWSLHRYRIHHQGSHNVRIKIITDPLHPAYGQRGLFAARSLRPREWIIDYAGEVLPDSNPQTYESNYCLRYVNDHSIDGWKMGNESRFVNDFRGVPPTLTGNATATATGTATATATVTTRKYHISKNDNSKNNNPSSTVRLKNKPNIEFSEYEMPTNENSDNDNDDVNAVPILGFRVMHEPIKKGQELLVSYGKAFWRSRGMNNDATSTTGGGGLLECPGRHDIGLQPFSIPLGASYLCFWCCRQMEGYNNNSSNDSNSNDSSSNDSNSNNNSTALAVAGADKTSDEYLFCERCNYGICGACAARTAAGCC